MLERLEICDQLVVGGGIANTRCGGHPVGKSLCEMDLIPTAKALMAKTQIPLPIDVVVAKEFSDSAEATVKLAAEVVDDDMILDIGPLSQARMAEVMVAAGTILKTALWGSSSLMLLLAARAHSPMQLPKARVSRLQVAAIRRRYRPV